MLSFKIRCLAVFLFVVSGSFAAGPLMAQESAEKQAEESVTSPNDRFMRIRRDQKGRPVAMETSIVRYVGKNAKGQQVTVDLIGAVHVGGKDYYEALNKQFEKYESLLYELVAPEGTVIPKGGRVDDDSISLNPVGGIQKGLKQMLDLEFQLEQIDYTRKNFVHADMTPTEFGESMKENEESIGGYALKAFGQSMAMQASGIQRQGASHASRDGSADDQHGCRVGDVRRQRWLHHHRPSKRQMHASLRRRTCRRQT